MITITLVLWNVSFSEIFFSSTGLKFLLEYFFVKPSDV
jgi:hypothetical protein